MKEIPKRAEADPRYKWKTEDLFATDGDWERGFAAVPADMARFAEYAGSLGESAERLVSALRLSDEVGERFTRLYVYAHLRYYEDTGNQRYKAMADRADAMAAKLAAAESFLSPEIIALGKDTIARFTRESADLTVYAHLLDDLLRRSEHVLDAPREALLARTADLARTPEAVFDILHEADTKFPEIIGEDGSLARLTLGNYTSFMESRDRDVRRRAYEAMYDTIGRFRNTYAGLYQASVTGDNFYAETRGYASALEMALSGDNVPDEVYRNLIAAAGDFLPALHKYMAIRKKALGVDKLEMYDMYVPIVPEADARVSYDEAKRLFLASLEPLGADYAEKTRRGMDGGWIDVYENENKRSGAFQWGAYGCHPFVSLNYEGRVKDMFTLAHEMGHAMHSLLTWGRQPFTYADYPIFLAEVASTVNEALLIERLLADTSDKAKRAYFINYYLEEFRGTLFRQTQFAEFELLAHEAAQNDKPLTADVLSEMYAGLNRKYYGGGAETDARIADEWARIPHFYNAYYVYKYATGYSAAIAIARALLTEGESARARYLEFLAGGSSDYPIAQLARAGVDMSSPEPIRAALSVFAGLVDEMETLI
ncbi:MAG: oligoendopeptidase F [Clostridiales bacterium]|jgi:oligoendopeptidase F|nr:oligoendopeptidase F [Clostridiales bacterium]